MGVAILSGEEETRKFLKIREDLERRIGRLEVEIEDLRTAITEIDRTIVRQGFRQPVPARVERREDPPVDDDGRMSIKSKDGTTLGFLKAEEDEITFEPLEEHSFTTAIPPFQSFFVERVLSNMRATDEGRVATGELPPDEVLSYEIITEDERILRIFVRNYGGERRLREVQSSLRWAFDKMYEKLQDD